MSLLISHRNAACRNADGTVANIARVDATEEYKDMIQRLSQPSSVHPSPPYGSLENMWNDIPRQILRRPRKALGLPASSDVGVLSKVLKQLREESETYLSRSINSAVISFPALPGLYEEAINDAADYLGLQALKGYFLQQPRQLFAAYAGHNMGLCSRRGDYECRDELQALPVREVMLVECTSTALLLHMQSIHAAIDPGNHDIMSLVDFDEQSKASPYEPKQLTRTITHILEQVYRFRNPPKKITVILSGERGGEAHIAEIVSQAVIGFGLELDVLSDEAEYVVARGASQLAWRAVDTQSLAAEDSL